MERGRLEEGKSKSQGFPIIPSFPYFSFKGDDLVKSQQNDGFVKSSRCKARKN
jgi:hypothetical protein